LGLILTEGLIQGVTGTGLGILLGYGFGTGMIALMGQILKQMMNIQVGAPVVSLQLILICLVVGVGITLLAGLLPAINASKMTPLEALRPSVGKVTFKKLAGLGFWSGMLLVALGVGALIIRDVALITIGGVLFTVGLILAAPALVNPIANLFGALFALLFARDGTAQLAQGNLSRQPGRAAITASTTMISIAILIMGAALISSLYIGFESLVRKSLGSDFVILPPSVTAWGNNLGADPGLIEELKSVDGVELVSSLRFIPNQVNNVNVNVLGIDPVTYPQVSGLAFTEGDEDTAFQQLGEGRNIILNGIFAVSAGVDIGDEIELVTPDGTQAYHIVAIAGDYLNAKISTGYISHANMAADFNRDEDILLQINLTPGADRQAAEESFKTILKPYPQFRLIDGQSYIEENLRIFSAAFVFLFGMAIFLTVPSLIAMVNTLAIGVIERTREIGMLRAVGARRSQVRAIIVSEALILSGLGTVFGVLAGLYLGRMAVEAIHSVGFPIAYAIPGNGILIAIVTGILFGLLAAVIPARQAARMNVINALRYE
jgi:putative ABC transport system permease protein